MKNKRCTWAKMVLGVRSTMTQEPHIPEQSAEIRVRYGRAAQRPPWGFPTDIQGIVAMLDAMPSRDDLAPPEPIPEPPPIVPRRKGNRALHGAAAVYRNRRLSRLRYHRLTPDQLIERNRKRRARYKETRAAIAARVPNV